MAQHPKLNFPAVKFKARKHNDKIEVWDDLRGCFLVLTPEERVRQHLIKFLSSHCQIAPQRIVQEYLVNINNQPQRADVVVVDDNGRPYILAECKAPSVDIDNSTLAQATRYNSVLNANYVILTNGIKHYCYQLADGKYITMDRFPNSSSE